MSSSPTIPNSSARSTPSTSLPPGLYPQFLLFGDSITQSCYPNLQANLSTHYSRRLDVLNRGFSGYTAPCGLSALSQFLPAIPPNTTHPHVRLITVFFGANDACIPGEPQHVPLDTYKDSLRRIATYSGVALHSAKVIFITPTPVDEWQLDNASRNAATTARYAAACRDVAAELRLPVLDLWTVFMARAGWRAGGAEVELPGSREAPKSAALEELLSDGLHFTAVAYQVLFDELVRLIEEQLPEESPDRLPTVFPDWKVLEGAAL